MDEVFLEADQSEKQFALPTLVTDAAGAPQAADEATGKPQTASAAGPGEAAAKPPSEA